jgi:N-glycosidase YbiA
MTIYFYRADEPYGCFSNFSAHGFTLAGQDWPTAEHFYQAQKFIGTPDYKLYLAIQQAASPGEAAALGRNPRHRLRSDWEQIKLEIMHTAVLTKFTTHLPLQKILLSTGERWIVENSPVDAYWGCGSDRQGQNHLGRILMLVRQELHQQAAHSPLMANG